MTRSLMAVAFLASVSLHAQTTQQDTSRKAEPAKPKVLTPTPSKAPAKPAQETTKPAPAKTVAKPAATTAKPAATTPSRPVTTAPATKPAVQTARPTAPAAKPNTKAPATTGAAAPTTQAAKPTTTPAKPAATRPAKTVTTAPATKPAPQAAKPTTRPAPQTTRPATQAPATQSRAPDAGKSTQVAERGAKGEVSFLREEYDYSRKGRRDPFVSLLATGDLRPLLSDLRLVGVAYDPTGRNSVAVMRDVGTKDQYRVRVGQTLGRMQVSQIQPKAVVFTVEEFGFRRTEVLALGDSTRARGQ